MKPLQLLLINRLMIMLALTAGLLSFPIILAQSALSSESMITEGEEVFGPANLLKTMSTPFTTGTQSGDENANPSVNTSKLNPIAISTRPAITRSSLSERFHGPKLFLPPRMVLGESSEFIVKGNPGAYVAIAMADKNSGAKPVCGHTLRLGPDRKLVGLSKISLSGVASIFVEMPIEGDLVGQPVYFEAAVWSAPNFSDLQIASAISLQSESSADNSVVVCGQEGKKPGVLVLDVSRPMSQTNVGSLGSGKP